MNPHGLPCALDEVGRYPVRPDAPGGDPVDADERFDRLQEIIDSVGIKPWEQVERESSEILTSVGKDLRVMSFLGLALYQNHGYKGLTYSFRCWCDLLGPMWEHVYPEKPRRRKVSVQKFALKTTAWIRDQRPGAADAEVIEACEAAAREFVQCMEERLAPGPPDYEEVLAILKFAVQELRAPLPVPEPVPEPVTASPPPRRSAPPRSQTDASQPDDRVSPQEKKKLTNSLQKSGAEGMRTARGVVLKLVESARAASPGESALYRIPRDWALTGLRPPPQKIGGGGETVIAPPDSRTVKQLTVKAQSADWEGLLSSAERAWQGRLFWLDPHRYVAQSLGELGHREARQVVESVIGELVAQLPELRSLQFSDGTPFADPETSRWLDGLGRPVVAVPVSPTPVMPVSMSSGGETQVLPEACRSLLSSGALQEAAALIEAQLAALPELQARFLLKVRFAGAMVDAGFAGQAMSILLALEEEIQQFQLEQWAPSLAAEALRGLLVALKQEGDDPDAIRRIRLRLAKLGSLVVLVVR